MKLKRLKNIGNPSAKKAIFETTAPITIPLIIFPYNLTAKEQLLEISLIIFIGNITTDGLIYFLRYPTTPTLLIPYMMPRDTTIITNATVVDKEAVGEWKNGIICKRFENNTNIKNVAIKGKIKFKSTFPIFLI